MVARQHLTHAPITEALVDFRADATKPLANEAGALRLELAQRFPKLAEQRRFEAAVHVRDDEPPVSTSLDKGFYGFRLESSGREEIAQFRLDGFTYNRLRPYTDGDSVLSAALDLWKIYVRVASPHVVSRVALRYINRLELPIPRLEDVGRFLTSVGQLPPGATGALESHLTRTVVTGPDAGASVVVTQAVERAVQADTVAVILDIDAFRTATFETGVDALRPVLDRLRALKNAIFFGSITDATVELYR